MIDRALLEATAALRAAREPHVIATVVATRGSVYRRPGARMVLTAARWIAGSVSGGCLEGDLARKAWWHTEEGAPVVVSYDSRVPDDAADDEVRAAFGLGCNGVVDVLIERGPLAGAVDPLALADECWRTQRHAAIATVVRTAPGGRAIGSRLAVRATGPAFGDTLDPQLEHLARAALATGESSVHELPGLTVFVEALVPPPRLFVFGAEHDALPVVRLGRELGWDVTVCAHQLRPATRDRFLAADDLAVGSLAELAARIDACDRAIAVVMNHNFERDVASLGAIAASRALYIGVLGPRKRTDRMLAELGLAPDARLHAPVGLELGAETPAEIALAVIAEIQAVLRRASAASLREHRGPIHERAA